MASRQPLISEAALADLDQIWEFIARDSPNAADRVIDAIYAAIYRLTENPGIGHLRNDLIDEPLRFWNVYSYLIVYRPEKDPIEIVRVVSGHRDIASILL